MTRRAIPEDVAEYLSTMPRDTTWRQYATYLYSKGYTLASIGEASGGVSRQYVQASVRRTQPVLPDGAPNPRRKRRRPYKRVTPPLSKETRNHLLGLWLLSTRYRSTHADDSPWAMARDDFAKDVERLLNKGYLVSDIATDLGVSVDALYRRIARAKMRGIIHVPVDQE
jgi:hypothetical protein